MLLNRRVGSSFADNLRNVSIVIGWENVFDENIPPNFLLLHLTNGFTICKRSGDQVTFSFIERMPEKSGDYEAITRQMVGLPTDGRKREEYQTEKGFPATEFLANEDFQHTFLIGRSPQPFFTLREGLVSIIGNVHVSYVGGLKDAKAHVIEISNFLGLPVSLEPIHLWSLIENYINRLTIQSEEHPRIADLALYLNLIKNTEGQTDKYVSIVNEFSKLFPNVSFDALSRSDERPDDKQGRNFFVKIIERIPGSKIPYTLNLDDSASGYYEALYLLSEKWRNEDYVLILDEPALRLHPNVIRHLGRILSTSERQVILVTHSPYFVDVSMLGGGRKLIYFKRKNSATTQVFGTTPISIRNYIFDPDVFFSRCIVLVEGPGDAASFYAISDALNSVLEQFNIHVVNSGGVGNIDPYIRLAAAYNIPYVGLVDSEYSGKMIPSSNFYILPGKLEDELASIGLNVTTQGSIDPNKAYEKVFDAMGIPKTRKKIHESNLGKVFDRALGKIQENPQKIWKRV